MRLLSVRLIVSLIVGITLVSLGFSYYQVVAEKHALRGDLERRAEVLGESLAGNVEKSWGTGSTQALQRLVQRFGNREHLIGVAVYDREGQLVAMTPELGKSLTASPQALTQAIHDDQAESAFVKLGNTRVLIFALPIHHDDEVSGGLAIVHDADYIQAQMLHVWRETFFRVLAQMFLIVLITLLIVRWSISGPIARAAQWMRAMRTGRISSSQEMPNLDMFRPLAHEVATMAESLNLARSAAENEARLREAGESMWTADRLSVHIQTRLAGSRLFVVSNREPYIHQRNGKAVNVIVPPSGLVTALEPVLNACDGTWIAHGSGDADLETVDAHDRLRVPPDDPRYTLRRVWLNKEEEEGYYYGFSNEGLWPLCHIAHTRPFFARQRLAALSGSEPQVHRRGARGNQRHTQPRGAGAGLPLRAAAAADQREAAGCARGYLLAYPVAQSGGLRHLPLAARTGGWSAGSRLDRLPRAVALQQLPADRGSHVLESRVDWEHFSILRQDHRTIVRPFPSAWNLTDDEPATASNNGFMYLERGR
jgi:uncharacterized membrane protein affecting hemolysin expression